MATHAAVRAKSSDVSLYPYDSAISKIKFYLNESSAKRLIRTDVDSANALKGNHGINDIRNKHVQGYKMNERDCLTYPMNCLNLAIEGKDSKVYVSVSPYDPPSSVQGNSITVKWGDDHLFRNENSEYLIKVDKFSNSKKEFEKQMRDIDPKFGIIE